MAIEITGVDELIKQLGELVNDDEVSQAIAECCLLVENNAKLNCPIGTGQLRSSITHEVEGTEGVVGTNVSYAPYVEYGTGLFAAEGNGRKDVPWSYQDAQGNWHSTIGQKPQPFLHPALEDNREQIIDLLADKILQR